MVGYLPPRHELIFRNGEKTLIFHCLPFISGRPLAGLLMMVPRLEWRELEPDMWMPQIRMRSRSPIWPHAKSQLSLCYFSLPVWHGHPLL